MAETIIWSVDAHGRSLNDAACEFAATFWDKPRRAIWMTACPAAGQGKFRVSEGRATYTARLVQESGRPAVYQVTRE